MMGYKLGNFDYSKYTDTSNMPWLHCSPQNYYMFSSSFNPGSIYTQSQNYSGGSKTTSAFESTEDYIKRRNKESAELLEKAYNEQIALSTEKNKSINFEGLTKDEEKLITEYYRKKNIELPTESFTSALLLTGVGGAAIENPRVLAHPINSTFATLPGSDANKMFKQSTDTMRNLWKNENLIMREAYNEMHRAEARSFSKMGAFRKRLSPTEYQALKTRMEGALKALQNAKTQKAYQKALDNFTKVSQQLRYANRYNNGWMANWFGKGNKSASVIDALKTPEAKKAIQATTDNIKKPMTFKQAGKVRGGAAGAILYSGMIVLQDWDKIKASYNKDTSTGLKQTGQTAVKAIGTAGAFWGGEALGVWGAAKLGAALGSCGGPVGTIIGLAAGAVVGSICAWAAANLTKKLVGKDVGDDLIAEQKKSTTEGKQEMLTTALTNAANDKDIDPATKAALAKVQALYEAQAAAQQQTTQQNVG